MAPDKQNGAVAAYVIIGAAFTLGMIVGMVL